ncbi:hypothetical protein MTO96_050686 [Rhipicephalus appendiculatus]
MQCSSLAERDKFQKTMNFNLENYARHSCCSSQFEDELLKKIRFRSRLTKEQQVFEVGRGIGHFARLFLLHYCQPCRRIVATDIDPAIVDFAREHFSHEDIIYDILDIPTPNFSPFLERYGKFDRIFFLAFHMIEDKKKEPTRT